MNEPVRSILRDCLRARLDEAQKRWLDEQLAAMTASPSDKSLHVALGMAPRRLGKAPLAPDAEALARLAGQVPGWSLAGWSVADAARVLLLASLPAEGFAERFRDLCQTADVAESIALYRGLPVYPNSDALERQVGEGLRGNVQAVFEAIAHGNPYARQHFDAHRWTHMVLKALFVGSRLSPIVGLDERANDELARIMIDFSHERRAAGRPVPWEIWRCVGPFARGSMIDDLARALDDGDCFRQAAALGLAASPDPAAAAVLDRVPELRDAIARGELNWEALSARCA
ncbi:EboA domain-containing protein [Burkholderiaceae bacterium FT117]|uniref:EboA domain-containing protein n=1 Tax=Zeimonas sediminis TaxID=2944268 RepID=UPI002342E6CF|nr:EboA domain-containing protein [Zeimonas sediminis]MCM5569407.1 EboA domain-containing protein [Zeimonas sediminis]